MEAIPPASSESEAAKKLTCWRWHNGERPQSEDFVPRELPLTIYINDQELVTILCTPEKLSYLVTGFLYSEGIISNPQEVAYMRVCPEDAMAEVRLHRANFQPPKRRTLTSGCGGGQSFQDMGKGLAPVESELTLTKEQVIGLIRKLQEACGIPRLCGGLHTSVLSDGDNLLVVAQDIGRHNTLDRIIGQCLLLGIPTRDRVLSTTGRLSSEMVIKAARMRTPIVISRSSPTDYAVALAERMNLTLIGYARGNRFSIYSHPARIKPE